MKIMKFSINPTGELQAGLENILKTKSSVTEKQIKIFSRIFMLDRRRFSLDNEQKEDKEKDPDEDRLVEKLLLDMTIERVTCK